MAKLLGKQLPFGQIINGRAELALGEVATGAEDDHGTGSRGLTKSFACYVRRGIVRVQYGASQGLLRSGPGRYGDVPAAEPFHLSTGRGARKASFVLMRAQKIVNERVAGACNQAEHSSCSGKSVSDGDQQQVAGIAAIYMHGTHALQRAQSDAALGRERHRLKGRLVSDPSPRLRF